MQTTSGLIAFRAIVGRNHNSRDKNCSADKQHENGHSGELGPVVCKGTDAITNTGHSRIIGGCRLASYEQQARRDSSNGLTHAS